MAGARLAREARAQEAGARQHERALEAHREVEVEHEGAPLVRVTIRVTVRVTVRVKVRVKVRVTVRVTVS